MKSINGSKILILGAAYKKDVDDIRESPSLKIIELLEKKRAFVDYNDPFIGEISGEDSKGINKKSIQLTSDILRSYDAVIILANHSIYDFEWIVENSNLIIDTRNAVKSKKDNVVKA